MAKQHCMNLRVHLLDKCSQLVKSYGVSRDNATAKFIILWSETIPIVSYINTDVEKITSNTSPYQFPSHSVSKLSLQHAYKV